MSISTPSRGQTAKSPELFRIDPNWLGSGAANPRLAWPGSQEAPSRSPDWWSPCGAGLSRERTGPLRRLQDEPVIG